MEISEKADIFIKYIFKYIKNSNSGILLVFLTSICLLAYLLPAILYFSPSGTDVYSHIYNTQNMADANSLFGFYEESFKNEYLGYDYPFGMWYFGAILMKVTGMSSMELVIILPLAILFITLILYYQFSRDLLNNSEGAILSTIFLISMPIVAIGMLNYSTSRFVVLFLIPIIAIALQKPSLKTALISLVLVFTLGFSHTGTFMFLIFFAIMYFLIYAFIWKRFDHGFFILVASLLLIYVQIAEYFPFVQPQYMDKGRFVLTMTDSIASLTGIGFISEMGTIFYETIFISNNIIYALFWSSLLYTTAKFAIIARVRMEKHLKKRVNFAAIPIIGNITQISHDIVIAPFWIGPVHTPLSVLGFFQLDAKGKCILLALIGTSLVPGAMKSAEAAGSLREIFYLFLIIPVAASAGFYILMPFLTQFLARKKIPIPVIGIYALILVPLIIAPVVGSIYYQPTISGTVQEKNHLEWLSTTGSPFEGVAGPGYRERIDIYANKLTPSIEAGSETKRYMDDLEKTYFYAGTEEYTRDLNSFNIKYILLSERVLKGYLLDAESLKIGANKMLDRIYASDENFTIYRYISLPEIDQTIDINEFPIVFSGENTALKKLGSLYVVENDYYKIKLGENTPGIQYIGTSTESLLGGGALEDFISVAWTGEYYENIVVYNLNELDFEVTQEGNRIIYRTTIYDQTNRQKWATIIIKYIFYEKAFKRQILVANDWQNFETDVKMNCGITTMVFAPFSSFEINQLIKGFEKPVRRHIYPSDDNIVLKDTIFNDIFINETERGFLIRYGDTTPYPQQLVYKGSPVYEGIGNILIDSTRSLTAAEPFILEQYYAVGTARDADDFIDLYTSVSRWDFPAGITPVVISGNAGSINETGSVRALFEGLNIPYGQIQSKREKEFLTGSAPIGQVNVNIDQEFLGQDQQVSAIQDTLRMTGASGVLFSNFRCNLDSIKALVHAGGAYAEAYTVSPPYERSDQSGARVIKAAYIEGQPTDIVLFPVSLPFSYILKPYYESEDALQQWSDIITGILRNGGIAIFQWDIQDLATTGYLRQIEGILNNGVRNGISFTTLDTIAEHYRLMQNVNAEVTRDIDEVHLNVSNTNRKSLKQATYRIVLPTIDGTAPYIVENGILSRQYITGDTAVLFVTCDLGAGERKEIIIRPSIERKLFLIDANEIFEGGSFIRIMDTDGNPVADARVTVLGTSYTSNEEGQTYLDLRRGDYAITIEKPGYVSVRFAIEVKGRIFRYIGT